MRAAGTDAPNPDVNVNVPERLSLHAAQPHAIKRQVPIRASFAVRGPERTDDAIRALSCPNLPPQQEPMVDDDGGGGKVDAWPHIGGVAIGGLIAVLGARGWFVGSLGGRARSD